MGVRRLQTFMEQYCPDSFYEVKIQDIADEYRRIHQQDPVIVVDGSCCFRKLYSELDWVCGGQYKEYVDKITSFIDGFERLGIKLVLYFDGATQEEKRPVWVNRRMQSMSKAQTVIDALKRGYHLHQIDKDLYVLPAGAGNVMSFISSTRCKVQRSITECDHEIISYAAKNKCLAVLAQDSDYVIYRYGAEYYLSSEHLDINKMTTFVYDKFALARHLKLHVKDLPVFASLMGNDHIPSDDLKLFHNRLTGRGRHCKYAAVLTHRVAEFVQNLPRGNALLVYLRQLSYDVFKTPNRSEDLRRSILSYGKILDDKACHRKTFHKREDWDKILSIAHTNYIQMVSPSYVYNLLRKLPFEMSTALEDFQSTLSPSAVVLRLMRQRIYGVVLCESPREHGSAIVVKEWCASGPDSLNSALDVHAILPPDGSPNLLDLWQNDSILIKVKKFELLGWIASAHLFSVDLNNYHQCIVPAICILSYLYHDVGALNEWEVRVFAAVVVEVQAMECKEFAAIQVARVDVRGVQLATLFTRAITHFTLANSICGDPLDTESTRHHHNFDGKLFQTLYLAGNAVSTLPKKGNLQHYEQICNTILKLQEDPKMFTMQLK